MTSTLSARDERGELARRSLLLCVGEIGRVPSRRDYDAWHRCQADRSQWASATTVRNTFGSWTDALAAVQLTPSVDVRARALARFGPSFTAEEITAALAAYAGRTSAEKITVAGYRAWVKSVRPAWARAGKRLPSSHTPILRVFGTWSAALAAAGVRTPERAVSRGVRSRGATKQYEGEALVAGLIEAAEDLGTRRLGMQAYDKWAIERCARGLAEGVPYAVARSNTLARRFGSWGDALLAAKVITKEERARVGPNGWTVTSDEMLHALAAAIGDCGHDAPPVMTQNAYSHWCRQAREVEAGATPSVLPSASAIVNRFGHWGAAVIAAIEAECALADRFAVGLAAMKTRAARPFVRQRFPLDRAAALAGLRAAMKTSPSAIPGQITVRQYEHWRVRHPKAANGYPLPRGASLARCFGGWQSALQAADDPTYA